MSVLLEGRNHGSVIDARTERSLGHQHRMLTPLSVTIVLETPALSIRIVNEAERSRTLNVTVTGVDSPLSRVNCIGPKDTNVPANVVIEMPKRNKALRVHCNAVACVKDVLTRHHLIRHSLIRRCLRELPRDRSPRVAATEAEPGECTQR